MVHGVVHGPGPWGGPWTPVHVLYTSSYDVYLKVKKGYAMVPRELRWSPSYWVFRIHCLRSKRAYAIRLISIASFMRRLNVLLCVAKTFVLLESTE